MRRVVQGIVAEEVARAGWAPRGAGGAPPSHRVAAAGGALERASGAGRPGEASGVGGAGGGARVAGCAPSACCCLLRLRFQVRRRSSKIQDAIAGDCCGPKIGRNTVNF
jgi:hypothetical protein